MKRVRLTVAFSGLVLAVMLTACAEKEDAGGVIKAEFTALLAAEPTPDFVWNDVASSIDVVV